MDPHAAVTEPDFTSMRSGLQQARLHSVPSLESRASCDSTYINAIMAGYIATWPKIVQRATLDGSSNGDGQMLAEDESSWRRYRAYSQSLANFIGRVWLLNTDQYAQDVRDRHVMATIANLDESTPHLVAAFLESRRHGHQCARGSGSKVSVSTLQDATTGLSFLFARARSEGEQQGFSLAPSSAGRLQEYEEKAAGDQLAEAAGGGAWATWKGNPLRSSVVSRFIRALNKTARAMGEEARQQAPVMPEIMKMLYDNMVLQHMMGSAATVTPNGGAIPPSGLRDSTLCHDYIEYSCYSFCFVTMARPGTVLEMRHKDVTQPSNRIASNMDFLRRHGYPKFITVKHRVTKTGKTTKDQKYFHSPALA